MRRKRREGDLHNAQAEKHNQTDLDAQFEVQVPEYHGRENGQEQIRGGVEAVGIIGEVDHGLQIAALCGHGHGGIPQRSDIITDAEGEHCRCSVSDELDDQESPEDTLVEFVGAEKRNEVDDEGRAREGGTESDDGDLDGDVLQHGFEVGGWYRG